MSIPALTTPLTPPPPPAVIKPPDVFRAFGTERDLLNPQPAPVDDLLDPKQHMSAGRAIGLFTGGLAIALSARWLIKGAFKNVLKKHGKGFETNNILTHDTAKRDEMNISQSFSDGISSLYRLVFEDHKQLKAFVPYLGTSIVGYLAGSSFQGMQETWVRREETKIRARLISRLQNAFRESIRTKQGMDTQLKDDTQKRVYDMLTAYGITNPHDLVVDAPIPESFNVNRNYVYQPTHRTILSGPQASLLPAFGNTPTLEHDKPYPRRLLDALALGAGAATGLLGMGLTYLFRTFSSAAPLFKGEKVVYETLQAVDKEAWWINGVKNPKNLAILGGFLALSAGAKLGKLFIDGLRQIQVTRANANTELGYQKHNWLTLDPGFHRTAETEAVANDLKLLERDLPYLKYQPALLRGRIQTMLGNIGRNSAPKYFPMTPMVGLVDARS